MDRDPIAIVGVACRFGRVPDPGAFWRMVMHRESAIVPFGSTTGLALPPGHRSLFDRPYPAAGGLLGSLYSFVPREQSLSKPISAGENQDLYFARQLAFDALADAALKPHAPWPVNGSVRLGYAPPFCASTVNWLEHTLFVDQTMDVLRHFFRTAPEEALASVRDRLVESIPAPDAANFLSGAGHRLADSIARSCSFTCGASTLDAGALSGVAAIRSATDDLRSGRVDIALAGAITPPLNRPLLEGIGGDLLFSRQTDLVPFDAGASGTLPGEGGALFVLKRERDALAAHDRIYALVKGVACGTGPTDELLLQAAERAQVPVQSIQLIEANGSGIPDEDAAEVAALQKVWGEHRPGGPLVGLGSVKGNVGHCLRAAAAPALLKTALALRRKVLPPQMPAAHPLESLSHLGSSVYLLNDARPWITGDPNSPRRAAVMVNDVTGRCAALVLEEEPEREDRQ